jgi:hypothetical protein
VNRWKAFSVHLIASILVFSSLLFMMFFVWYPGPFFMAEGGLDILGVIGGVDVVLGPLLTLIVFRPGKPHLKFDLTVIVLIQLAALFFGGNLIFRERPAYAVFVPNAFIIVSTAQIDVDKFPEHRTGFFSGPQYVVSMYSHDPELWKKYPGRFVNALDQAANGPEFFEPYREHNQLVAPAGRPLYGLAEYSEAYAGKIERFLRSRKITQDGVFYIPLKGRIRDTALVIRKSDGEILGAVNIDPGLAGSES